MKTKRHLRFILTLLVIGILFWVSCTPRQLYKTFNSYEDVNKKESELLKLTYSLPTITPTNGSVQTQTKGGVTITCEVIPFNIEVENKIERKVFYADPNMPGYDVFQVAHKPSINVNPKNFQLNIKIKNNQERILKVRETALLVQIDGVTYHIPEASLTDWYAGMIIKKGEFNYRIQGPEYESIINAKLVYLFINDVPTVMDDGGNIKKRENFEWYFQCKNQTVTKDEVISYTYETSLIETKRCDKCNGTGTDPQAYKCSTCGGAGKKKNIYDGKIYTCYTCSGSGIVHIKCPDCSGVGTFTFPKSNLPKITKSETWSGFSFNLSSIPSGAKIELVEPKTGEYYTANQTTPCTVNWYCKSNKECPIIVSLNGKEVKIKPYNEKGKQSSKVKVDFTKENPVVIGGTIVH